jgi:hypothetical protein
MSKPKIYKIPRQFVTLRLSKQEWKAFRDMSKKYGVNQTQLATAIIGRSIAVNLAIQAETKSKSK